MLQNHLWGEHRRSVLLVLQGLDAAGKDGTIRHVFTGVNPQGCRVVSFKAPNDVEAAHDFLWRVHHVCPRAGEIGIFNRSHYEDVVTTFVLGLIDDKERRRRLRMVRDFEHLLVSQGTAIVKVFLHISKDEQRERLQARIDDPEKRWKFNPADLDTRAQWDAYQKAYSHGDRGDVDRRGAVVRRARRPQVGAQLRGVEPRGRGARGDEAEAAARSARASPASSSDTSHVR